MLDAERQSSVTSISEDTKVSACFCGFLLSPPSPPSPLPLTRSIEEEEEEEEEEGRERGERV